MRHSGSPANASSQMGAVHKAPPNSAESEEAQRGEREPVPTPTGPTAAQHEQSQQPAGPKHKLGTPITAVAAPRVTEAASRPPALTVEPEVAHAAPFAHNAKPKLGSKENPSTASTDATERQSTIPEEKPWSPWQLQRHRGLAGLLAVQILTITTINLLLGLSFQQSGFITVPDPPSFLANNPDLTKALWSSGFMWTFFPTLWMQGYGMFWDSVTDAMAERQPFVSMGSSKPQEKKQGPTLEYQSHSSWTNVFRAFKHRHKTLGVFLALSLLWGVVCVPLTSFLFTDVPVVFNNTELVLQPKRFNGFGFSVKTDMRQILEVVSATEIYDANRLPWTTGTFAFPPFYPPDNIMQALDKDSNNMTISTVAYSASLDCQQLFTTTAPSGEERYDYAFNSSKNLYTFPVIQDRGCKITPDSLDGDSPYPVFVRTWSTSNCGFSHNDTRLSILSGYTPLTSTPNQTTLRNLCIPYYSLTQGDLTVTFGASSDSPNLTVVSAFSPTSTTPRAFEPRPLFEQALHLVTGFSPSDEVDGVLFGQMMYALSKKQHLGSELEASSLMEAALTLFSSIFAVMAERDLFEDVEAPEQASATRSVTKTRLVVVLPIYLTVTLVLILMSVVTVVVLVVYESRPCVLKQEISNLRGYSDFLKEQGMI
ncbi:hypothetical protein QBC34DRAFT_414352 [Podospora aff. communis PSN243]|uniref:Uncharacterized protein n=1 Tax=Podospora aff. communis PSN243 TaxID=3040156 RepID=A0AAV9GCA5_9PEZI|nr:hypothetical protein QBC34DRAFT_414352 [Podospora aff. communis PSN243]